MRGRGRRGGGGPALGGGPPQTGSRGARLQPDPRKPSGRDPQFTSLRPAVELEVGGRYCLVVSDIYGLRIFNWPLHTKDMEKVYKLRK